MTRPVAILGTGGHAMVVREALELMGREVAGCFAESEPAPLYVTGYVLTLGMGRRTHRRAEVAKYKSVETNWVTVIHPSATVSPSAQIGEGAQLMAGAIIQAGANIGKHAIINTGAQVDHGCIIGDFAHICPGTILCADVMVEDGAMVEPGVVVRRGTRIMLNGTAVAA